MSIEGLLRRGDMEEEREERENVPLLLATTVEDTLSSRLDASGTWAFSIAFDLEEKRISS